MTGDEPSDLEKPSESIRLLHEFARSLPQRGVAPDRCADWEAALLRLEVLLAELWKASRGGNEGADFARNGRSGLLDGFLVTDTHGVIQEANHGAADLFVTRREFLLGRPLPFFLAEGYLPGVYALLAQKHEPLAVRDWHVRLRPGRKGGQAPLVSITMMPIVEPSQPVRLRWLVRDLGGTARPGNSAGGDRELAVSVLDAAQAIVLLLDGRGRIVHCNPFARAASGLEEQDLLGQDWRVLLTAEDHPAARETLWQALAGGVSHSFVGELATAGGRPRAVAWSAKAMPAADSSVAVLLVLGHDINELQESQQRALRAERLAAVGEMTAALTHESRNLLQSSQACLERLRWRLKDQPEALDLVGRAQQAQGALARMFEDIRLYAAPLNLELGPCCLPEVWREAWAAVTATQPNRRADLDVDRGELDLWFTADRMRLGQVFRNIFENSFAACVGPVLVAITCRPANLGSRPALRVAVRDNGPGLDGEQRRRIFEAFYTTRSRGSGLGMAIAHRIMQSHGGEISVGENGPGAEIILLLPRQQP
jgi:PAS domain S-box-containing protein